jgi:hypothetical protein
VGTPALPCDPATAQLIITTGGGADRATTGTCVPTTGSGGLCLYVAAANSAGESARVKIAGTGFP